VRKLLLISLPAFICASGIAQIGGQNIFQSLQIAPSARQAALGGNVLSPRDGDLALAIFNPALLDSNMHNHASLSYVNYYSDINLGFASYARSLDSLWTVSGTMQYVSFGDFDRTDETGAVIGQFSAGDYAFIAGASRIIDTSFTLGANLKVLYGTLDSYSSFALATDLAASYINRSRKLEAAIVFGNIGYQLNGYTDNSKEKLPLNVKVGITKRLKHAPLRFNFVADNLQKWNLDESGDEEFTIDPVSGEIVKEKKFVFGDRLMRHLQIGTEVLISQNVNIRIGYNYRRRQELKVAERPGTSGLSWGLGLKIKKFNISYGRAIYHLAGPSNHFTFTRQF